jgi:CubicO group peptidase (beta-lactamase class C family)
MHRTRSPLLLIVVSLVACRPGATYSPTDPGPVVDGGQDFSTLDTYLDERLAAGLSGFAMQVVDAEGRVVYRREAGQCASSMCPRGKPDYTVQLVTGIASSSKWVTSTVVLAAIDEGVAAGQWPSVAAALDATVMPDLGCDDVTGPVAEITVRQLLSFTSGLRYEHPCIKENDSLLGCACEIVTDSAALLTTDVSTETRKTNAHLPGTTYKYGASHLTVAGAWLERVTGETFDALLGRLVRTPLGIEMQYVRATNLAGSIYTSVADTTRFVDAHRSDALGVGPRRLLSVEAAAEQRAAQAVAADPSLTWLITPQTGMDYGLNVWRSCLRTFTEAEALGPLEALEALPDPACDEVFLYGHGGKGGYNPFVDAAGRYAAVYAMREASPGAGEKYTDEEQAITTRVRLLVHLAMTR